MKTINSITLLLFLICSTSLYSLAQDVDWVWAKNAGGSDFDQGKQIATDNDGNIIVAGLFKGPAQFGTYTLTSSGGYHDVFIAKYDEYGKAIWAISFGGTFSEDINGLALDNDQNIYVTGTYSNTLVVGYKNYFSKGSSDIYTIKLDPSGNVLWVNTSGSKRQDMSCGITVEGYSIYTGGTYWETFYAEFDSIKAVGLCDIYIQKLDTSGNLVWLKSAGGKGGDFPKGITANANLIFICGQFNDSCYFDDKYVIGKNSYDIFNAVLSPKGDFKWAKSGLGDYGNYPNGISSDDLGNTYLTGCFGETISFDNTQLTSSGKTDAFIVKYDSFGVCHWAVKAGGALYDQGTGIFADSKSGIVLTGFFDGQMNIGSKNFTGYGGKDIFVAEYDASGTLLWAKNAGGSSFDFGLAITKDNSSAYATGYFTTQATFGSTQLNAPGTDQDLFIARLAIPPPATVIITKHPQDQVVCEDGSAFFNVGAIGKNLSFQWKFNGNDVSGATDSFLTLIGVDASNSGSYTCTISDSAYSVTSDPGILTLGSEPVISQHPQNATVTRHSKVTLKVLASGANSYQWQKDGTDLTGETLNTLIFSDVQFSDEGKYRCVVSGICGIITSDESTLTIITTGISDPIDQVLSISPNPTKGIIEIRLQNSDKELQIEIYDTKGKRIIHKNIQGKSEKLDLSHLNKGIYIILAKCKEDSFSYKIILK
ncbi:MAG: T9SS type A sorting domain-containing protein [Bacteroidetes bacterium]|nr:T9SS type A sorting domain-containing protein [Bacteroidota bacterium]